MSRSRRPHAEKRWAILWTESAHLIWKLRCERVITNDGDEFSEQEVRNRWRATINRRLSLDREVAALTTGKRRKRAIGAVDKIWRILAEDGQHLPDDWVVNYGVLVGIRDVG